MKPFDYAAAYVGAMHKLRGNHAHHYQSFWKYHYFSK